MDKSKKQSKYRISFYSLFNRGIFHKSNFASRNIEGYFTVEASLLLPTVFAILVLLIMIMFFMNGKIQLTELAYGSAIKISSLKGDIRDSYKDELTRGGLKCLPNRLSGFWNEKTNVVIENNNANVEISAKMNIPLSFINPYNSRNRANARIMGNAVIIKPVEIIRFTRIAERIGGDIWKK